MLLTGTLYCPGGLEFANCAVYDSSVNNFFISTENEDGELLRIDAASFACDGFIDTFEPAIGPLLRPICDSVNNRAYFAAVWYPWVARLNTASFSYIDYLEVDPDASPPFVLAQDSSFVYAIGANVDGYLTIYKISKTTFTVVDTLILSGVFYEAFSAVVAESEEFLFVGCTESPGVVVKINLSTYAYDSEVSLGAFQDSNVALVIDEVNNRLYFACDTDPPVIVRLDYDLNILGAVAPVDGAGAVVGMQIDDVDGYIVICRDSSVPDINLLKISSFTFISFLSIITASSSPAAVLLDVSSNIAYIVVYSYGPIEIYRIADFLISRVDHLPLMGVH